MGSAHAPGMALREFTDDGGVGWRVWDVRPENLHPTTRTEDYLRDFLDGWLAFESLDGNAKRRLHPIPQGWDEGSVDELNALLSQAQPILTSRVSPPYGLTAAEDAANPLTGGGPRSVQRTFRFPGGRYWSVLEWPVLASARDGRTTRVLRFISGSRMLELESWPRDWSSYTDDRLAVLLSQSFPREPLPNRTPHSRRAGDMPTHVR